MSDIEVHQDEGIAGLGMGVDPGLGLGLDSACDSRSSSTLFDSLAMIGVTAEVRVAANFISIRRLDNLLRILFKGSRTSTHKWRV